MSSAASPSSLPTPTPPSSGSDPYIPRSPPLSVGLAIGLVLCPVMLILLVAGFRRVARKGDVFQRLPTARLQDQELRRRFDLAKFIALTRRRRPYSPLSPPWVYRGNESRTSPDLLPVHVTLPTPPPPVYTPSTLPSYDVVRGQPIDV